MKTRDLKKPPDTKALKKARLTFQMTRRAERQYAVKLRKIAKHVGEIINAFPIGDVSALPTLQATLNKYAEVIRPWARATSAGVIAEIGLRDKKVWEELSDHVGRALGHEIRNAPTGVLMRAMLDEQVNYITSLPIEAGQRVHRLTLQGLADSTRFEAVAQEIRRSGEVTASRATLIARTETARTASLLTQSRAEHVGCVGYVWRTVHDSDVRKSHREMEGKFVSYEGEPPLLSDGTRTHAGQIYNCRCYQEPVIPDSFT